MPRRITKKQKAFVKEYLKTGKATKSVLKTYNTTSNKSASVIASNNLKSKQVQTYMNELLTASGLGTEQIAQELKRLYNASTTDKALKRATPELAFKILQEASKLQDLYPAEKKEIKKQSMTMNLDNKDSKELIQMLKQQQKDLQQFNKMVDKQLDNVNDSKEGRVISDIG